MLARHLSRQVWARSTLRSVQAALPVHGLMDVPRRSIMSQADLAPMEELSAARQKLRQVLDEYRQQK